MASRKRLAQRFDVEESVVAEILDLEGAPPTPPDRRQGGMPRLPLADETHVSAWAAYACDAGASGVLEVLKRHLFPLRFPIASGLSRTEAYVRAARRGIFPADDGAGPALRAPERLELFIHPSPGGEVPVLRTRDRADFETLVRVFAGRNEPIEVPASMGACLVRGLTNWGRVDRYRRLWEARQTALGEDPSAASWSAEFGRFRRLKWLYQDTFLILSGGPYSGVPALGASLEEDAWLERSAVVRLEHECFHYLSLRFFGRLHNRIVDEIVADFSGLVAAFGEYRADLALRFLGLEDFPKFRPGARLENYRGAPPVSPPAFELLRRLAFDAIHWLSRHAAPLLASSQDFGRSRLCLELARFSLFELATGSPVLEGARGEAGEHRPLREQVLEVPESQAGVGDAIEAITAFSHRHGVPNRTRQAIQIVADEVLSNIARNAHTGAAEHAIRIAVRLLEHEVEVEVVDRGRPFDPLGASAGGEATTPMRLEDRPVGGLGLYLVHQLSDRLEYAREAGCNRLIFAKGLAHDATASSRI